jgi:Mn-dependent DtxR family transcriptional regulator
MTEGQREEIKEAFNEYLDCLDRASEINKEKTALKNRVASIMEVDGPTVTAFFNMQKLKMENGVDRLAVLMEMSAELSD